MAAKFRGEGVVRAGDGHRAGLGVEGAVHRVVRLLREAIDGATRGAAEFRRTRREVVQGSPFSTARAMRCTIMNRSCRARCATTSNGATGEKVFRNRAVASPACSAPGSPRENFQSRRASHVTACRGKNGD